MQRLETCDNLHDDLIKKEQINILETDVRINKSKNYNPVKLMNIQHLERIWINQERKYV